MQPPWTSVPGYAESDGTTAPRRTPHSTYRGTLSLYQGGVYYLLGLVRSPMIRAMSHEGCRVSIRREEIPVIIRLVEGAFKV